MTIAPAGRRHLARVTLYAQLAWQYRLTLMAVVGASIGLLAVFRPVASWLTVPFALIAVPLVYLEISQIRDRTRSVIFQRRDNDEYEDVSGGPPGAAIRVTSGGEVGFILTRESVVLRKQEVPCEVDSSPFMIRSELERWAAIFLVRCFGKSDLYNLPALGQSSDCPSSMDAIGAVRLRRCEYYDHVTTNRLAQHDIFEVGRVGGFKSGRDWFVNGQGTLRPLLGSWLANIVGVSTLAFTRDGKLVLIQQTDRNVGSPGLFAPSGSGALEPSDVEPGGSLQHCIQRGANRELCEEANVSATEIEHTEMLSFGRLLSRGGNPDYYALTLLAVASDDIEERPIRTGEKRFVARRVSVRLSPMSTWTSNEPVKMLPQQYRSAVSLPLAMALAGLAHAVECGQLSAPAAERLQT